MRKLVVVVSILALSALAFASLAVPAAQAQEAEPTIVDIAASNEDFSTLVAAVQAAGLADTLAGEGPFTVFAPTNDGFNKTLGELGLSAEDVLGNQELLTDILLYHVAAGALDAQDVLGQGELTMLNGDTATAEVIDGVAYIAGVPISNANIRTSNGIIHVIDAVMIPPAE
jgi:transforming growth factor-beta-induced protein